MTEPDPAPSEASPRAHRRRSRSSEGRATSASDSPTVVPPASPSPPPEPARKPNRGRSNSTVERGLRSLVSSRPTQLSTTEAMRAREVAMPTAEDLAAAEQEVVLIHRNYVPPAPLKSGRKGGRSARRNRTGRAGTAAESGRRKGRQEDSRGADGSAS